MSESAHGEPDIEVPVMVIGGSMVGLATAMFLAQHGVPVLSVEKHHTTAIHPRAGYFQLRTIELMRVAGIEDRVRAASLALYDPDGGLNNVESLHGREIANYIPNINAGVADVSPARRLFMPQQVLEPILLQRARELGAEFMYSNEVVDVQQDDDGVSARIRHVTTGEERIVRSRYLVACDGNRSPMRERLGIGTAGHGLLSRSVTIYFRADCSVALAGRNLGVIYVTNPTPARILPIGEDRARRIPRGVHGRRHQRSGCPLRGRHRDGRGGDPDGPRRGRRRVAGGAHRGRRQVARRRRQRGDVSGRVGSSSPGTPPTRCRPPVASAATPACTTPTTWPGSWRTCCAARRAPGCSTPTTRNVSRRARRRWSRPTTGT